MGCFVLELDFGFFCCNLLKPWSGTIACRSMQHRIPGDTSCFPCRVHHIAVSTYALVGHLAEGFVFETISRGTCTCKEATSFQRAFQTNIADARVLLLHWTYASCMIRVDKTSDDLLSRNPKEFMCDKPFKSSNPVLLLHFLRRILATV